MNTALVSITCTTKEEFENVRAWLFFLELMTDYDPTTPYVEVIDEVDDEEFDTYAFLTYMPIDFAQKHIENPDNGAYGVTFELLDEYLPFYDIDEE